MLDMAKNSEIADGIERRTTADFVFERLHEDIVSLKILPGSKLSEVEVARRFGVSRQPVRDAFARLGNQDLLVIRPQKATEVRSFSMEQISHARFVRLAVELEVIRCACIDPDETVAPAIEINLELQRAAIESEHSDRFHDLDYDFHRLICEYGRKPLAFETIKECKQKIDRLCVLSLTRDSRATTLVEDHCELIKAIHDGSVDEALIVARRHLERLDETISLIHKTHAEYFE